MSWRGNCWDNGPNGTLLQESEERMDAGGGLRKLEAGQLTP